MIARRSRGRSTAVLVALALLGGACGGDEQVERVDPIFALERDVVSEIQPLAMIDPEATIPAADLRHLLQALLTEHSMLSIEAMRQAIDGGDLGPTTVELTANTDGLTQAIGLIYGESGAFAFDQLWTNHIEFFNRYGAALRAGNETELTSVRLELTHYEGDFSSYVEAATAGELDLHAVEHVLHSHVEQLLGQADAWAAGDYTRAYDLQSEAFRHMDVIALALATGFSGQQPQLFPGDLMAPAVVECAAVRLSATEALSAASEAVLADLRVADGAGPELVVAADYAAAAALAEARALMVDPAPLDAAIAAVTDQAAATPDAPLAGIPAARDAAVTALLDAVTATCPTP